MLEKVFLQSSIMAVRSCTRVFSLRTDVVVITKVVALNDHVTHGTFYLHIPNRSSDGPIGDMFEGSFPTGWTLLHLCGTPLTIEMSTIFTFHRLLTDR